MPKYDYECPGCTHVREIYHGMFDEDDHFCTRCGPVKMDKVILQAPSVNIPPQHQSSPDKLRYYGITDITTGAGITKDTDVREKPGIRVKGTNIKSVTTKVRGSTTKKKD